jgi:hypothetical protein
VVGPALVFAVGFALNRRRRAQPVR